MSLCLSLASRYDTRFIEQYRPHVRCFSTSANSTMRKAFEDEYGIEGEVSNNQALDWVSKLETRKAL